MKKFNIFKTFDLLFRLIVIFLICLVWCRYFIKSLWLSLTMTFISTLAIDFVIRFISKKRKNKQNIKQEELDSINQYINTFIFMEESKCVDFFYNLATKKYKSTKKTKYVLIEHPNSRVVLYPFFVYRDFCLDDLIFIYNKTKNLNAKRLVVCTKSYDQNINKFIRLAPMEIIVLNSSDTYLKLLKKYEYYPDKTIICDAQKTNFNDLVSFALNKKRTKGYFISSILLLLSSFIVSYKIYYVIMSTVLLLLAIVSFYNPKFNKKIEIEVLGD